MLRILPPTQLVCDRTKYVGIFLVLVLRFFIKLFKGDNIPVPVAVTPFCRRSEVHIHCPCVMNIFQSYLGSLDKYEQGIEMHKVFVFYMCALGNELSDRIYIGFHCIPPDVFYIGGTKCGLLFGEALVCTRKGLIPHLTAQIKQHGALLAKGRLLGVQFQALFTDDLYLKLGECAIRSADRIRAYLKENGFTLSVDSPTNQVFFTAENDYIRKLADKVEYGFMEKVDEDHSMIRFCTSWSTTDEQTDRLLELISSL